MAGYPAGQLPTAGAASSRSTSARSRKRSTPEFCPEVAAAGSEARTCWAFGGQNRKRTHRRIPTTGYLFTAGVASKKL